MDIFAAVISGIAGTAAMSLLMAMGPKMGMPAMDIVGMLGSMFGERPNRSVGWIMHTMMGIVFALIYALLWSFGIGSPNIIWGVIFGSIHWLAVGVMMGVMPMMHAGIKSGSVNAPGVLMLNNGGMMAFVGGLMGHLIFAIVVAAVYGFLI